MNPSKPNQLPRRTGLFGGTFNPIHIGHQRVALDVQSQFGLDRIYFVPSAKPPHKQNEVPAAARDRLEMVRLALAEDPSLQACDVEIQRGGASYSVDTVRDFKARLPDEGCLFFIIGVDAFLEIHTWKNYASLFGHVSFIVMSRPPDTTMRHGGFDEIETYVQLEVCKGYTPSDDHRALIHPTKPPIHFARVTPVAISARRLRRMLQRGLPAEKWLSPAVADYIKKKGLYR